MRTRKASFLMLTQIFLMPCQCLLFHAISNDLRKNLMAYRIENFKTALRSGSIAVALEKIFGTSVRGSFFAPQIAANASLSCFGAKMPTPFFFMAAAFFFAFAD